MSKVKIWLHCVWSIKNEACKIPVSFCPALLKHIRDDAAEKKINLEAINAREDHVHALVNMGKQQNLSTIIQYLKGESAFWINQQKILPYHFAWQDDYIAVSISHSQVDRIKEYIKNQDAHHLNMSWEEEVELFVKKYGFEKVMV